MSLILTIPTKHLVSFIPFHPLLPFTNATKAYLIIRFTASPSDTSSYITDNPPKQQQIAGQQFRASTVRFSDTCAMLHCRATLLALISIWNTRVLVDIHDSLTAVDFCLCEREREGWVL